MPQFQPAGSVRHAGGRPPGSRGKKTLAQLANVDEGGGISPLEILLRAARCYWQEGDMMAAVSVAEKCAPYCHAKLTSVDINATMSVDPAQLSDAQIVRLIAASGALGVGDPMPAPGTPLLEHAALTELEGLARRQSGGPGE